MGRKPCCEKVGLKKGPWTLEEDKKLINFMLTNCQCSWRAVPKIAGLLRCGKSCRLRWINYLRPDLKRGLLSESEEKLVIDLHAQLGNRWSKIASHLPGRTDNEIKNYWNTHIKKKLRKMGIDPTTHSPIALTEECHDQGQLPQTGSDLAERCWEEEKTIEKDACLQKSPGFCIEEVPMIGPHEIVIPLDSTDSSSSRSPCSSPSGCSLKAEDLQFSAVEWPESIYFSEWDLTYNHADEILDLDPVVEYQTTANEHDPWK